jgi:hypothetical protein
MELSHVAWRKSQRSHNGGANCVEIAAVGRAVAVRDSKEPDGGRLAFTPHEWSVFADRIKHGAYDLD